MAKMYRVYEASTNKLHPPSPSKEAAIDDANSLAGIEQISGSVEVHEFEVDDLDARKPVLVYRVQA